MDCRGRVLSNEYFDVITNFPIPVLNIGDYDFCYASVDGLYYIVYVSQADIRNADEYIFE